MFPYTSDENNWLSRAGKAVMDYCEIIGTARARNQVAQYNSLLKSLEKQRR